MFAVFVFMPEAETSMSESGHFERLNLKNTLDSCTSSSIILLVIKFVVYLISYLTRKTLLTKLSNMLSD